MKRISPGVYRFLFWLTRIALFLWHPVFRVEGREHIPAGPCLFCSNHSGYADPLWDLYALNQPVLFRFVAKEQLMRLPVLGRFFHWIGMIGIRRGEQDVAAIKACLRALKDGEKVFLYPEGTRVRAGRLEAKTGALMLAGRTGLPVVPLYTSRRRRPFTPVRVVIGEPFLVEAAGRRATAAELRAQTDAMMDRIYEMGGDRG